MHLNHIRGAYILIIHRPKVLSLAFINFNHRLDHLMFRHRHDGWSRSPEQITFMITDQCNLRCKMCHYAHSDEPDYQLNQIGMMPPELFRKVIDEIPGRPYISFTGGEPLLHPQIAELIHYAEDRTRFCALTTNGWMLKKRARELCDAGLDLLVVSVDGPPEIHNAIRGHGSFEHLDAGIKEVMSLPNRPLIFINMSLSNINFDQMISMYEKALNWRVDGINFNHLWYQTPEMIKLSNEQFPYFEADRVAWEIQPSKVDSEKVADSLKMIWKYGWSSSIIVNQVPELNRKEIISWYHSAEKVVKYKTTRCPWIRMKVWPDGSVRPCRSWQVGNVASDNSMQVWNNEDFRTFRTQLSKGVLPICSRCCYLGHR